ncbi:hypothetical protein ACIHCV_11825 [Streptomyces sp. NPDC051956]|uniref:hypothetical protein n=1 Tax=Streptomyces sp. NPDC051956 TaxID=3365677 RepID=UPI0037D16ED8
MPRYRTTRPRNCDPTATQWLSATTDGTDEGRSSREHCARAPYFSAEPPAPHIRLSFAAIAGPAESTEGIRRLRAACDGVLE